MLDRRRIKIKCILMLVRFLCKHHNIIFSDACLKLTPQNKANLAFCLISGINCGWLMKAAPTEFYVLSGFHRRVGSKLIISS